MAASRIWRRSATAASRSRQNLPRPFPHSRSRADIASLNADWAAATAGVTRDARAVVTSAMLTEAKPIPATTAKAKVIAQTTHPATDAARRPMCQSLAAHIGVTSAARSAATPMAKNSHPARSLDPSDRANQPFVVSRTAASGNAAAANAREAIDRPAATAGGEGGVTSDSAGAESLDEKSTGITDSENSDLAIFVFRGLRGLFAPGRCAPVLALLG